MTTADEGYAICKDVLPRPDLALVEAALRTLHRTRAGARHLLRLADVGRLARDARLIDLAARFIGEPVIPLTATLFDKSADANWLVTWHQDTALPVRTRRDAASWGPWSMKAGQLYAHAPSEVLSAVVALRVHLDDSAADNGPLRVLPGTHRLGRVDEDQLRAATQRVAALSCLVAAGGVIAMRPLTIHASSKATSTAPRRVLHIEYAPQHVIDRWNLVVG